MQRSGFPNDLPSYLGVLNSLFTLLDDDDNEELPPNFGGTRREFTPFPPQALFLSEMARAASTIQFFSNFTRPLSSGFGTPMGPTFYRQPAAFVPPSTRIEVTLSQGAPLSRPSRIQLTCLVLAILMNKSTNEPGRQDLASSISQQMLVRRDKVCAIEGYRVLFEQRDPRALHALGLVTLCELLEKAIVSESNNQKTLTILFPDPNEHTLELFFLNSPFYFINFFGQGCNIKRHFEALSADERTSLKASFTPIYKGDVTITDEELTEPAKHVLNLLEAMYKSVVEGYLMRTAFPPGTTPVQWDMLYQV